MGSPSSLVGAAVRATGVGVEWPGVVSAQINPSSEITEASGSNDEAVAPV